MTSTCTVLVVWPHDWPRVNTMTGLVLVLVTLDRSGLITVEAAAVATKVAVEEIVVALVETDDSEFMKGSIHDPQTPKRVGLPPVTLR